MQQWEVLFLRIPNEVQGLPVFVCHLKRLASLTWSVCFKSRLSLKKKEKNNCLACFLFYFLGTYILARYSVMFKFQKSEELEPISTGLDASASDLSKSVHSKDQDEPTNKLKHLKSKENQKAYRENKGKMCNENLEVATKDQRRRNQHEHCLVKRTGSLRIEEKENIRHPEDTVIELSIKHSSPSPSKPSVKTSGQCSSSPGKHLLKARRPMQPTKPSLASARVPFSTKGSPLKRSAFFWTVAVVFTVKNPLSGLAALFLPGDGTITYRFMHASHKSGPSHVFFDMMEVEGLCSILLITFLVGSYWPFRAYRQLTVDRECVDDWLEPYRIYVFAMVHYLSYFFSFFSCFK